MNKKLKATLAMLMCVVTAGSMVACGEKDSSSSSSYNYGPGHTAGADADYTVPVANLKEATYRTTTSMMPSNWNELTYDDNNDRQILSYISSEFFEYDYLFNDTDGDGQPNKYNADGTINVDAIELGGYTTNFSAATGLEDVTATVDAKWGYTHEQKVEGGYAWKITLRNDLKWDDGTPIKADDFLYSMDAQLDPDFMNMRANTYYDTLRIKNSRAYFYKNQEATYPSIASKGYKSNAEAVAAGVDIYLNVCQFWKDLTGQDISSLVDKNGNKIPQWLKINDETGYDNASAWGTEGEDPLSAKDIWDAYVSPATGVYASFAEVGESYESCLGIKTINTERDVTFADVGMYKVDEYSFVICLDKSYQLVTDDNELSYLAAYYMASLPLVKQSLYESCKKAPEEGSTLWTTNYNTSLETTASWGPYKLESFQGEKSYKLVKNDNWYGYHMGQYANQYKVTAIECECVPEAETQWMYFFAGQSDDATLDSNHIKDYMNSKYTTFTPGTGTFAMQLFGDLATLKKSDNNNGILAIDQFRQAFSYALNRDDVVEKIWPGTSVVCLGLMNSQYLYNVENGGAYRYSTEGKEALLRAYGFTKGTDGKWSNGAEITNASFDDAYEALTGYNPTLAKQLLNEAITELTTNAEKYGYDASKKIKLVYGASSGGAKQQERMAYLQGVLDELAKGTALEGKFELVFDASAGNGWADAFRSGKTQIGFGYGFSGNPFNPFDIIGSFVDPDDTLNYHTYWNTNTEMMTLTLPAGDYEQAGQEVTMSLVNWFDCLNGLAEVNNRTYQYNWDAGFAPTEARLTILAALEEQVIKKSYSVMLIGEYDGSLLSAKFTQFFTDDYNTFMGYGGIRYMTVNYTDTEWETFVANNGNDLSTEYKKAN